MARDRVLTSDAEIDAAIAAGNAFDRNATKIVGAAYDAATDEIAVRLDTGARIALPRRVLPGFENIDPRTLVEVEIGPAGASVWFDPADTGFRLETLIVAVAGMATLQEMSARTLGSMRSERKAAAVRANGRKGGRPRKTN